MEFERFLSCPTDIGGNFEMQVHASSNFNEIIKATNF